MKRIICLTLTLVLLLSGCGSSSPNPSNSSNTETEVPQYIEWTKTDELKRFASEKTVTPLQLSDAQCQAFINLLNAEDYSFHASSSYGLNEALQLYRSSNVQKSTDSNLLDSKGYIDASKLLASVRKNNKNEFKDGKNAVNTFYSETSNEDQTKICNLIAEVINKTCNETERRQMGNTLTKMAIFNHKGSPSNAYVTNHLTFVYNPTMSEMYADSQNLVSGESKENMLQSVLVHEIMHLIQHRTDDLADENGIEVGFCRTFNPDNSNKIVPVDSLWFAWLLEASAEMRMANYLNIDTHTYAKKISYVDSYNLSRFRSLKTEDDMIEQIVFKDNLEDVYKVLGLSSVEEQQRFLEFMYSVEIIQSDPEDFWENYQTVTQTSPTDEEKLNIRLTIRSEVIKYLTKNFYTNLVTAIREKEITDYETLFYLMRIWEIDVYGHLEYTKIASLDAAKSFIGWHDKVQTALFSELSTSSGSTGKQLQALYESYCLQVNMNETISDNCSLDAFLPLVQNYLSKIKTNYYTNGFIRNKDMVNYLLQQ